MHRAGVHHFVAHTAQIKTKAEAQSPGHFSFLARINTQNIVPVEQLLDSRIDLPAIHVKALLPQVIHGVVHLFGSAPGPEYLLRSEHGDLQRGAVLRLLLCGGAHLYPRYQAIRISAAIRPMTACRMGVRSMLVIVCASFY